RAPGARLTHGGLEKEVFRQVIGKTRPVDGVALEVLDAQDADIGADLEVLGVDALAADLAALDLRIDDRTVGGGIAEHLGIRSGRNNLGRRVILAAAEPGAAWQDRREDGAQKKNANPRYFHSSTSSLSSRLVKMTLLRYSVRSMKRRVR